MVMTPGPAPAPGVVRSAPRGLAAVVAAVYAATLILAAGPMGAVRGLVVQALFAAPGVIVVARLLPAGRRWLAAVAFGPLVGLAASSVALLAFWAAGGRGPWLLAAAPLVAAAAGWPFGRLRERWTLIEPLPGDCRALLAALLIVPVVVVAPFAKVGAPFHGGRAYRAYFTADYVWERAVVAELAKGDFLPKNPYFVHDVMHYYWLPHLESAVEHRAWPDADLDAVLLARSTLVGAMFVAAIYGLARLVVAAPWAAAAAVWCGFFATSFEGVAALYMHWKDGAPLEFVRYLNIDAFTRWYMGAMPIDGLQRILWYQPHHATGYVVGCLGLLAVGRRRHAHDEAAFFAAGVLLALSTVTSSFAGLMFTTAAAFYEAARTMVTREWRAAAFNAAYAALPLALAVAVVTALRYVEQPEDSRLSVIRLGLNTMATRQFWTATPISAGPALILGTAGLVVAYRRRLADVLPLAEILVVSTWFYFYVDVRDHEDVYVGWRVGHLAFIALVPIVALLFASVRRGAAMVAIAVVVLLAVPTVAIDIFNTQDLEPGGMRGHRIEVLTAPEVEGLAWLKAHTDPDAVVQVDTLARGDVMWAYVPAFAERRMGAGVPISMVPLQKYQEASKRITWLYDVGDALAAYELAARVGINYIVVGPPERQAHPGVEDRFAKVPDMLPQVFRNSLLSVYAVKFPLDRDARVGR